MAQPESAGVEASSGACSVVVLESDLLKWRCAFIRSQLTQRYASQPARSVGQGLSRISTGLFGAAARGEGEGGVDARKRVSWTSLVQARTFKTLRATKTNHSSSQTKRAQR